MTGKEQKCPRFSWEIRVFNPPGTRRDHTAEGWGRRKSQPRLSFPGYFLGCKRSLAKGTCSWGGFSVGKWDKEWMDG